MNADALKKLKNRIKGHEGLRLFPYLDTKGKWTIGYGRNLSQKGITEAESEMLLQRDIDDATADLYRMLPFVKLIDDARKAVFIELSFNMGIGGLLSFRKMIEAAKKNDWELASKELLSSKWRSDVGENRSNDLAYTLETGIL